MGASAIGLSHVAVQFPMYEYFKTWLGERRRKEHGEVVIADRLSTVDLIVASSSSKVIGPAPSLLQGSKAVSLLPTSMPCAPLPPR